MKVAAENLGVARYISDDPFTMLKMARYGTSFNLDGIWGGNMYAGGAGAILPNKITSKHNYPLRAQHERTRYGEKNPRSARQNGYKDVQISSYRRCAVVQDVLRHRNRASNHRKCMTHSGIPHGQPSMTPKPSWRADTGPLICSRTEVGQKLAPVFMPIAGGAAGHGGMAHAANEYFVIEGAGKVYGMAGAREIRCRRFSITTLPSATKPPKPPESNCFCIAENFASAPAKTQKSCYPVFGSVPCEGLSPGLLKIDPIVNVMESNSYKCPCSGSRVFERVGEV